ncbi:hypothetical protein C8R47DRAFT_59815 [Mycena vitilis]|nr:hypothetical protein C8R47DRAFT_59815 [Mycena vitilis]
MDAQHHASILQRANATPRAFIENARRQSPEGLSALLELSSVWAASPSTMDVGIIDMFLSHLRAERAPRLTRIPRKWRLDADFAFLSIMGLGRMTPSIVQDNQRRAQMLEIVEAWPGIFRWCSYIYDARVAPETDSDLRRIHLDGLNMLFYAVSRYNKFLVPMVENPACLQLATKLWALEDIPRGTESIILGCAPTNTLSTLIRIAGLLGKTYMYKSVLSAVTNGSNEGEGFIAELILRRMKKTTRGLNSGSAAFDLSYHIDLIQQLCMADLFHRSFFDKGAIITVTIAFVSLSRIVAEDPTEGCITMLVSCFAFFSKCLEGDDYPSLTQAIRTGIIPGILDCSPAFTHMPADSVDIAMDLLRRILPRYFIYRSFVEAVIASTDKLNILHYQTLTAQSLIRSAWTYFSKQLAKRARLLEKAKDHKRSGNQIPCENIKCQNIKAKQQLFACSACRTAHYCSTECQKDDWKAGHKRRCTENKAEHERHQQQGRPKDDLRFAHAVMINDADMNITFFQDLAAQKFPSTPRSQLMLCIDYTVVPEEYRIKLIEPGASANPGVFFSAQDSAIIEQQFQGMVQKNLADPNATIIQSIIPSGATVELLLNTIKGRNFWTGTTPDGIDI